MGSILSKIDDIYQDERDRLQPQIEAMEKQGNKTEAEKLKGELMKADPFRFNGRLHLPCRR